MAQAPIMPVATDALLGDTLHLSAEEFGAYLLILLATWRNNGKPLLNDDAMLAKVCRVSKSKYKAKLKLLLLPFFDISDGYLHQKRLEKEWKRVEVLRKIRSEVGKLGGRPKSLNDNDSEKAIGLPIGKLLKSKPITKPIDSDSPDGESVSALSPIPEVKNGQARRRSRIPADWQPSEEDRFVAVTECGIDPIRLDRNVVPEFRDYWLGRGDPHASWSATFRNRCRQIADRERAQGGRSGGDRSRVGGIAQAARDVLDACTD